MTDEELERAWLAWTRHRTCWHESGHALVGILVGRPLELVSTRPGEQFNGITLYGKVEPPDLGKMILGPFAVQDPPVRAYVEREIMVDLAGLVGALFCPPPADGYWRDDDDDDDERRVRAKAEALARQSPRHQELLVTAERGTEPFERDEERAWAMSALFLESAAVVYHVEWLRAGTQALLERHGGQLAALAAALYEHHVITASEVDAALVGTRPCGCHRWSPVDHPKEVPMSVLSRKPKVPTVYVARASGVAELDGQNVVFSANRTRVPAGLPLLKVAAAYFEPDASGANLVEPQVSRQYVPPVDTSIRLGHEIPPERRVRARSHFFLGRAAVPAGSIWDSEEPIVKQNKQYFEPAPPEEPAE